MKVNELYPSKWLKADDMEEGEKRVVTIKDVTVEEFEQKGGKREDKPVVEFYEVKPMVLNKTNASIIAQLYGNDTDDWSGKKITLFTMEVDSFGDIVTAIRVKNQVPKDGAGAGSTSGSNNGHAPQRDGTGLTAQGMAAIWAELQREGAAVGMPIKDLPDGGISLEKFQDWQVKARERINMATPVVVAPAPMVTATTTDASPFDDYDDSDPFADS